ncbi:MAG: YraN family protein [Candidatus Magasanikbacteria bacterium]|nr:YraN family protein [Candidatus Magasanikbacteria bacterium]
MQTQKQTIGAWGEKLAASFLVQKKYEIIAQNFRTKKGEVDIIAWHEKQHHGKTLCFIEVKTRGSQGESGARATAQQAKLVAMQQGALLFCIQHAIAVDTTPIQFEYVGVLYSKENNTVEFQHLVIPID